MRTIGEEHARTRLLIGEDALAKLMRSKVAVFGLGGVGGYVVESLARAGIGELILVDRDRLSVSNRNRQILATKRTVGESKALAAKARVEEISDAKVTAYDLFYLPETEERVDLSGCDYLVDCVDTVAAKMAIVLRGAREGIPVVSVMGTGNKLHPELFRIADIYDTAVCPLCKVMRSLCRKNGIERLSVVYSEEEPHAEIREAAGERRVTTASISFVPPVAGLLAASKVVNDIIGRG